MLGLKHQPTGTWRGPVPCSTNRSPSVEAGKERQYSLVLFSPEQFFPCFSAKLLSSQRAFYDTLAPNLFIRLNSNPSCNRSLFKNLASKPFLLQLFLSLDSNGVDVLFFTRPLISSSLFFAHTFLPSWSSLSNCFSFKGGYFLLLAVIMFYSYFEH